MFELPLWNAVAGELGLGSIWVTDTRVVECGGLGRSQAACTNNAQCRQTVNVVR